MPRNIANLPNSHLAPTAKELVSTSSKDELCHSRQGLKCREWLMSHEWSSCDHCLHLWVGLGYRTCIVRSLAHSYLDHTLKTSLNADSSALVPNCHMDTSEPVPNCPDISDPSRWCRSVLGPVPGLFVPKTFRSQERIVPMGNFRSRDFLFPGTFVP